MLLSLLLAGSVIGKGAFGMVIRAVAVGIGSSSRSTVVAVKTLRGMDIKGHLEVLSNKQKMLMKKQIISESLWMSLYFDFLFFPP